MPYIFSTFRYAFGETWKIVALAETFGLKYGIGYMFFSVRSIRHQANLGLDHDVRRFDACPRAWRVRPTRKPGVRVAKLLACPRSRVDISYACFCASRARLKPARPFL
ncbi:hypothetical protein [Bradyrhizobium sp.]|uniref:hypothetical protein n=1 Tax=Bradyrhizobium sp. TaxID=376 RepID=UPI003C6FFEAD